MRDRAFSLLVAVMLVTAALPAGIASAQSDAYQKTIDGHPEQVVIKYGDMDGEFEVQISSDDAPGRDTVLREVTVNTNKRVSNIVVFQNYGAYETVTATVTPTDGATGEPTFGDENTLSDSTELWDPIGGTGGDRDLTCDTAERIGTIVNPDTKVVDCMALPGSTKVNTTDTDANQTQLDIYGSAQNSFAAYQNYNQSLQNRLEDTKTIAQIKGKNAYIRSLNNGSSKAVARQNAKKASDSYYATIEAQYLNEVELAHLNANYLRGIAENESGINDDYIRVWEFGDNPWTTQTVNVTLSDGTEKEVFTVGYTRSTDDEYIPSLPVSDADADATIPGSANSIFVEDPTADEGGALIYPPANEERNQTWNRIESQRQTVNGELDTFVNNTYEAYQNGEINNSDLVDPYVLSSEYSPGNEFQGWAAAQLTLLGANSPEAFDSIGHFNITTDSGQYQGVLMSQSNPESGSFENGTTYDPANINGTQYVVTDDDIVELTSSFTISAIRTSSGESRENVTIVEKNYETTNTTELKNLYDELATLRAEIEAREKRQSGGAGGFLPDMGGSTGMLLLVGAGAAAALYLNGDD